MLGRLLIYGVDEAIGETATHWLFVEHHDESIFDAEPPIDDELTEHCPDQPAFDPFDADKGPARRFIVTDQEELFGQLNVRHHSSP
jgi:hypothetical protein